MPTASRSARRARTQRLALPFSRASDINSWYGSAVFRRLQGQNEYEARGLHDRSPVRPRSPQPSSTVVRFRIATLASEVNCNLGVLATLSRRYLHRYDDVSDAGDAEIGKLGKPLGTPGSFLTKNQELQTFRTWLLLRRRLDLIQRAREPLKCRCHLGAVSAPVVGRGQR